MPRRSRPFRGAVTMSFVAMTLSACGGGGSSSNGSGNGSGDGGGSTSQTNQPPTARISVSDDDGFAPHRVIFSATGSTDPDGTITGYRWQFGDDTSASGATVEHTYDETGAFTVTLRVTDDGALTDVTTRTVRVRGATLSGAIRIAPDTSIDSDVNDRFTTPVSNDTFGEAQPLNIPVRLGGFVNVPGTGSSDGNFFTGGDESDMFLIHAFDGGERIVCMRDSRSK